MSRLALPAALLLSIPLLAGCLQPTPEANVGASAADPFEPVNAVLSLLPEGDRVRAFVLDISTRFPGRAGDEAPSKLGARELLRTELSAGGLAVVDHAYEQGGDAPNRGVNVLGMLPGRTDRWIVVGAHYDSVRNSPGAWDDGSGTGVVLELARSAASREWNHGLIFALWDDEEEGLVGSENFVLDHVDSTYSVAAMFQFDAPGFNYPCEDPGLGPLPLSVYHGLPGWRDQTALVDAVRETAVEKGYPAGAVVIREGEIVSNPPSGIVARGTSDHASFAHAGVPYLFFFSSTSHELARVQNPVTGRTTTVATPWTMQFHGPLDTYEQLLLRCGNDAARLAGAYQTALDLAMGTLIRFDAVAP